MTTVSPERFKHESGGIQLVGDRWDGDGVAVPVVLAHGGGQTRHSWGPTAERLAALGHTVVNYDARGHGDSGWSPSSDYELDAFASDLREIIGTLHRPPVLVGASLGGSTSLVVAGENPGIARGLVCVDVVIDVEPAGVSRIHQFMCANVDEGFGSLEEVADAVAAYNPVRQRTRNLDGMRKNVRRRGDGRWYWHWDPKFLRRSDERQRPVRGCRLRKAAANIRIPTLIVRGGRSDVVSVAGLADMLARISGAEAIDVAGAGHMVAGDDNDVFAEGLVSFVSRIDPREE